MTAGAKLSGHLPALDGIRGLAILMVTVYRFSIGPEYSDLPGSMLFSALKHGDLGVDLFFVLSGFLITGLLLSEAVKSGRVSLLKFYGRRARRILPAAGLTLIVW